MFKLKEGPYEFEAVAAFLATPGGAALATGLTSAAVASSAKPGSPPPIKKPEKAKTAPTPDDKTAKRKRQQQVARKAAGTGRASTFLTEDDKLG